MNRPLLKPAEKLEIQFKKHLKKGHLHNVVLRPNYIRSGLPPGEEFLVDIIDRIGRSIPFTGSGFLAPDRGFIRYVDVKKTHWISKNLKLGGFKREQKQDFFDRLELELSDNSTLCLHDLDQAYNPLLKFFQWLEAENK